MSRKTHSNSDTSISEKVSEYRDKGRIAISGFLEKYPTQIFIGMITTIVVSFFLVFFVLPEKEPEPREKILGETTVIGNRLMEDISAIKGLSKKATRIAFLKEEIQRIINQESISEEDSIIVEQAIQELEYFNTQQKEKNE